MTTERLVLVAHQNDVDLEVRPESALTDCEGHFVPMELDIFE